MKNKSPKGIRNIRRSGSRDKLVNNRGRWGLFFFYCFFHLHAKMPSRPFYQHKDFAAFTELNNRYWAAIGARQAHGFRILENGGVAGFPEPLLRQIPADAFQF